MARGKSKKKRRKSRMSLTGLLAFVFAPLGTFFLGVPGQANGFLEKTSGGLGNAFLNGLNSLSSAYFGYNFIAGKFTPMALLQGYLPVIGHIAVRKFGVNRRISNSIPMIL